MATQSETTLRGQEVESRARVEELLESLDGGASPISFGRGPVEGSIEVVMIMTPKGVEFIEDLAKETGTNWETVLPRALVLYKKAIDAVRDGKAVGIAEDPNSLDVQFTKL